MELTHFDAQGNAHMVDVSDKAITYRTARATGKIFVSKSVIESIQQGNNKKGDVLGVARIAGIMASKKTSELIPLCHVLSITHCSIYFEVKEDHVICFSCVKTDGKTGVEMEALCACQVALLTIYDMCKAIDKAMRITDIHLVEKTGGKSGNFIWKEK